MQFGSSWRLTSMFNRKPKPAPMDDVVLTLDAHLYPEFVTITKLGRTTVFRYKVLFAGTARFSLLHRRYELALRYATDTETHELYHRHMEDQTFKAIQGDRDDTDVY